MELEEYGEEGACAAPERTRFATESDERYPFTLPDQAEGGASGTLFDNSDHRPRSLVLQKIALSVVQASQRLKEKDKAKYEQSWFNSCNIAIYTPYQLKNGAHWSSSDERKELVVDSKWWTSQSDSVRETIRTLCQDHGAALVKWEHESTDFYPHRIDPKDVANPLLRGCYNAYHSQFEYKNFAQCVSSPVAIVELSSWETRLLIEIARKRCLTGHSLRMDDLEDFSRKTLETIQNYLDQHQATGVFVKTLDKSAKNDVRLEPLYTLFDVISQLTFSRDVLAMLEFLVAKKKEGENSATSNCCYLILMPWHEKITALNEFRVFCRNQKVVAMAQQKWYLDLSDRTTYGDERLTPQKAIRAARATVRQYEQEWAHRLPPHWSEAVLDVWVEYHGDDQSSEDGQDIAHLIEVNPGGRWASSGSSLFEWKADVNILHREVDNQYDDDIFVRILVNDEQTSK